MQGRVAGWIKSGVLYGYGSGGADRLAVAADDAAFGTVITKTWKAALWQADDPERAGGGAFAAAGAVGMVYLQCWHNNLT